MNRWLILILLASLAFASFAIPASAGLQQNINYSEGDCDHRVVAQIPNTNWESVWITSDPGIVETSFMTQTIDGRFLLVASSAVTLTGIPVSNTWSCFFNDQMPQARAQELIQPLLPAYYVLVDGEGNITVEYVDGNVTWTPEPTATITPTNTETPTPTETSTPTPTIVPPVQPIYLPIIMRIVPPGPTATPDPNYSEGDCGQYMVVQIFGQWTGAWTTTDAQVISSTLYSANLPGRALILASSNYTLATSTNTWTCYYKGELLEGRKWELLNAPAYLATINAAGEITLEHYTLSNVTSTPAPTATPDQHTPTPAP